MRFAQAARTAWICSILLLASSPVLANPIEGVETGTAGFVGTTEHGLFDTPQFVESYSEFVTFFGASTTGLPNPYLAPSVAAFFANGGERLFVVRVPDADDDTLIGVDGGPDGPRTGLQSLLDIDEICIVAIPGATSSAVQGAMIDHCEAAGERMAVLDPSSMDDLEAMLDQRAGLDSAGGHAAVYFPWVEAAPAGVSLILPPSGFVAAAMARVAPPDAPVGTLTTATDVTLSLTPEQIDLLTQAGVNPLRRFSGTDVRIWGARTISSDPEWRYISVRRMANFLEESIYEGTEWALFEQNDGTLWDALEVCVDEFLYGLYQLGWFQGPSPSQAYFVRCDLSTMTENDIDEGRTIVLLGFAPIAPAEFVIVEIVQQRDLTASVPSAGPNGDSRVVAYPNPFRGDTTLRFDLDRADRADRVRIRIFDASGRSQRSLVGDADIEPGTQSVVWDGRNEQGEEVPAGVYLIRLEADSRVEATRVSILR